VANFNGGFVVVNLGGGYCRVRPVPVIGKGKSDVNGTSVSKRTEVIC